MCFILLIFVNVVQEHLHSNRAIGAVAINLTPAAIQAIAALFDHPAWLGGILDGRAVGALAAGT